MRCPLTPLPASAASPSAPAQGEGGPDPVSRQGLVQGSPLRALRWAPHQYSLRSASWVRARSERAAAGLQRFPPSLWNYLSPSQPRVIHSAQPALHSGVQIAVLNFLTSGLVGILPPGLEAPHPLLPALSPPCRPGNVPQWSRLHPAL